MLPKDGSWKMGKENRVGVEGGEWVLKGGERYLSKVTKRKI